MNLEIKKNKKKKGFTLIEMLMVIFVVGVGLVGALSFFNVNLNNQFEVKRELIASGLAQEGVDLVRNIVDYNYLNSASSWYYEVANNSSGNSNCSALDVFSLFNRQCETGNAERKKEVCLNSLDDRYYQCGNVPNSSKIPTIFSREIIISGSDMNGGGVNLDSGDCLEVAVVVSWNDKETRANDIICKPRQ